MTTKYLHTINGKPAAFDPVNGYIYYRGHYQQAQPLANSLRQIRREQKTDEAGRREILGTSYEHAEYDYVLVKV